MQLVLEETPPLFQQSVVTRTRFNNSPYGLVGFDMPIGKFGITTGKKPSVTGAPKTGEDIGNSKGARPKEGKDQGAVGPNLLQGEFVKGNVPPPEEAHLAYVTESRMAFCLE